MRRSWSMPVLVQVAALAALAVIMSQAVAFGVLAFGPDPRPPGFGVEAAAKALQGQPADTDDGRALKRRFATQPVTRSDMDASDPIAQAITVALAHRLNVAVDQVRVSVERRGPFGRRGPGPERGNGGGFGPGPRPGPGNPVFVRPPRPDDPPQPPAPPAPPQALGPAEVEVISRMEQRDGVSANVVMQQLSIRADRLSFAPFAASVRQPDGRWAIVEPPRGLLSPWQVRILLALVISMLLLAPLVWVMARRLTQPIRAFAAAAERLGANPDAEPLSPSGPSEVRTAIAAFNDMQASLRDHMRRRTQTVAAIAHDLRTPLTRLRFRAEQAPEALRDRMAADVEEMDALIAQAMAYVRGEAAQERRERLDLTQLAEACADSFSDTDEPVVFEGGRPMAVLADPAALRRALANLIGNAVKYAGSARVATRLENGQAVVAVEDDGPGLADADIESLFEPFARGERSRSRETGGAGLGLTVARQVARAHGGDIDLIPRPEGGLTARLRLPLA